MRIVNGNRLTDAGNDPQAMELLMGALSSHVDDPMLVAADVFALLHEAGIRFVPSDVVSV